MTDHFVLAHTTGAGALASWTPLAVLLGLFGTVVVCLLVFGRGTGRGSAAARVLLRIPDGLERVTGIPGWAAAAVGTSLFGLLLAGTGFYNDVAWHVGLGRDKQLFTAPHTMIVVGLALIAFSAVLGTVCASLGAVDTGLRWRGLRVPWSMLPLGALGGAALTGFPLDDLWHAHYGIDVTMWSPTHLLMICGASLSGMAAWLVLAEAGVAPSDGVWARGVHLVAAWLTLAGLSSVQGEFAFGVPQFQQLYHPVLIALAAGFALVAARLVLGPGWTLAVAVVSAVVEAAHPFGGGGLVPTRPGALYVGAAVVVEATARLLGTKRRVRFALASGVGVGTIGLAVEWAWNARAYQPWRAALMPDAFLVGGAVALGAAVLGAAFAGALRRQRGTVPVTAVLVAGAVVAAGLAVPLPRRVGHVTARVHLDRRGDEALVSATLDPPGAADHARWFQAISWQGGRLVLAEMRETGPGHWVASRTVPVTGKGKALLRLHRGAELMAIPIRLPADPEISAPEIPAVDRSGPFVGEQQFLLREQHGGSAWFAIVVFALLGIVVLTWVSTFALAASEVGRLGDASDVTIDLEPRSTDRLVASGADRR